MTRYVDQGSTEQTATASASMEIPEEAVHKAIIAAGHSTLHGDRIAQIRAALEAALPYLVAAEPQPAGGREAAIVALMRAFEEAGERDRRALDGLGWVGIPPVPGDVLRQHCTHVVDIVMGSLAAVPQPVSTTESSVVRPVDREALWEAVVKVRDASPRVPNDADSWDIVDAVLAVLAGGES